MHYNLVSKHCTTPMPGNRAAAEAYIKPSEANLGSDDTSDSNCRNVLSRLSWPQETSDAEGKLARLALTSKDCAALMPDGGPTAHARIHALEGELSSLESELAEADAQHRYIPYWKSEPSKLPPAPVLENVHRGCTESLDSLLRSMQDPHHLPPDLCIINIADGLILSRLHRLNED